MNFVRGHPCTLVTWLELCQWPPGLTLAYALTCIVFAVWLQIWLGPCPSGLYGMNFVRGHPCTLVTWLELCQWPPGLTLAYALTCIVFAVWLQIWLGPCPSIELFWSWFIDCGNTFTQRWHQLLAGFQFWGHWTHSSTDCKLWSRLITCDKWVKVR